MNNSRWSSEKEIKDWLNKIDIKEDIIKSGVPIISNETEMYITNRDYHTMVVGSSGSGKTQTTILPQINLALLANESVLVNDIKGELYQMCADNFEKAGYKVYAIDFENSKYGNSYNPFTLPYQLYKDGLKDYAIKCLDDIGYYLFKEKNGEESDFWLTSSSNLFTGLSLYLFENANEDEINLNSIHDLAELLTDEKSIEKFKAKLNKSSAIYYNISGTINAPIETRGGILSTFFQKTNNILSREDLSNLLLKNDLNFKTIGHEKVAIFMISGINGFSDNLIPLFINQIYDSINYYGNDDKCFNVILDEFDNLIPIKNFAKTLNYARGLGIKFITVIQNFTNLKAIYGKENTEILKLCFPCVIYLLSNDTETLKEIINMAGNTSNNKPLISLDELKRINMFEAIVFLQRSYPFKTKLQPNYKINWSFTSNSKNIELRKTNEIKIYKF